jgi:hypothetical protein
MPLSPGGWLEGASDPTNTSKLSGGQLDGVHCDFCHRKMRPVHGARNSPTWRRKFGTAVQPTSLAKQTYDTNIADLRQMQAV